MAIVLIANTSAAIDTKYVAALGCDGCNRMVTAASGVALFPATDAGQPAHLPPQPLYACDDACRTVLERRATLIASWIAVPIDELLAILASTTQSRIGDAFQRLVKPTDDLADRSAWHVTAIQHEGDEQHG